MDRAKTMIRATTGAFALLAMIGAACAKSGTPAAGGQNPSTVPKPAASGVAGGSPSASASPAYGDYGRPGGRYGSSGGKAKAGTIRQGVGGFMFSPATFTVKKGGSITIQNVGQAPHTFTIAAKGIDVVNDPGQAKSVKIDLAPGTYEFVCRFHASFGMRGVLTVTG